MFEKIIPVIIALIALQLILKYKNKQKNNQSASTRNFDYKRRINEFVKAGNPDKAAINEKPFMDDIQLKLSKPDLLMSIPENMKGLRRDFKLIVEGVTYAVKGKIGTITDADKKYDSPEKMFDEILEVVNRHRIIE